MAIANKNTVALRKRSQIAKANRTMLIWVACASVVVSVSAVLLIVLFQKIGHNQKAINKLNETATILKKNNDVIDDLEGQIRSLGSNEALLKLRTNEGDNALRVILDALPADSNPSALGASLQSKLLGSISVESVEVTPTGGDASDESTAEDGAAPTVEGVQSIGFNIEVRGSSGDLKDLLSRFERSIRTIQVTNIKIESAGDEQTMSIQGVAYYLPAKVLKLKDVDIQP